tara:strand:+ start:55 stop:498 length:444 start_codon:yes stop_codon:yes gene_type:complete
MTEKNKTLEKLQLEMKDTLEGMRFMDVVSASSRNGDIRFLCRVHDEKAWLRVLSEFLANEGNWYSFIGKKYFVSKGGGLVFGWVLIFESDNLDATVQDVRKTMLAAYTSSGSDSPDPKDTTVKIPGGQLRGNPDYSARFGERVRLVR